MEGGNIHGIANTILDTSISFYRPSSYDIVLVSSSVILDSPTIGHAYLTTERHNEIVMDPATSDSNPTLVESDYDDNNGARNNDNTRNNNNNNNNNNLNPNNNRKS